MLQINEILEWNLSSNEEIKKLRDSMFRNKSDSNDTTKPSKCRCYHNTDHDCCCSGR